MHKNLSPRIWARTYEGTRQTSIIVEKSPAWPATPPSTKAVGSCTAHPYFPLTISVKIISAESIDFISQYLYFKTYYTFILQLHYNPKTRHGAIHWMDRVGLKGWSTSVGTIIGLKSVVSTGLKLVWRIPSCPVEVPTVLIQFWICSRLIQRLEIKLWNKSCKLIYRQFSCANNEHAHTRHTTQEDCIQVQKSPCLQTHQGACQWCAPQ